MTELHVVSIEEVRALVAERQRYDDWLSTLEARRAETSPRVYERVREDYLGRRADVLGRLGTHAGGLAALADDLRGRLTDLEAQLGAHEDELAEGMLRNLVGEYDGHRWDTVRQDIEAKIAAFTERRAALVNEFDDVRTLLESVRFAASAEARPEGPVTVTREVPDEADVDVEDQDEALSTTNVDDVTASDVEEVRGEEDPFDDLAFLRSVTEPTDVAVEAPPPAPVSPPPSVPAADPNKILRCTECGTMNLPTEWYCERCGGELAAL